MAINDDGAYGEQRAIEFFKARHMKCFQSDLMVKGTDGQYFVVEVKHQDKFVPPPFEGHGLPPYQVDARMAFHEATGIRCFFLVFDKDGEHIYGQWLDKLEDGEKAKTATGKRTIYPIRRFLSFPSEPLHGQDLRHATVQTDDGYIARRKPGGLKDYDNM